MDWYYSDASGRNGPVGDEGFTELVRSGVVNDETLVWNVGMPEWQRYAAVRPGAQPAIAAPPPVPGAIAFCSQCGRQVTGAELVTIAGRPVCGFCKPALVQHMREGTAGLGRAVQYGGFWIRFVAVLIDYAILGALNVAMAVVLVGWAAVSGDPNAGAGAIALVYLLGLGAGAVYEGYFLSTKGATPGKMALGLRVVRPSGAPITFGLAVGRHFAKIISGMILAIGYIMAGFDEEKRSLHDRICGTRVIKG